MSSKLNFIDLIENIVDIDKKFVIETKRAINTNLTLRNWFIGAYIHFYELKGSDRAEYGDKLLSNLSEKLNSLSNCNRRLDLCQYLGHNFFRFLRIFFLKFYRT